MGDPLDRAVEKVQEDVKNEMVSFNQAEALYGVVIRHCTLEVDMIATETLRAKKKNQVK